MSSENYKAGDTKNVLLCGQINDVILDQRGRFLPEFYIMVDHTGNHYKLIGYKKKQIFKSMEVLIIPVKIFEMIAQSTIFLMVIYSPAVLFGF